MLKTSAILLLVAMMFTTAAQIHPARTGKPVDPATLPVHPRATGQGDLPESLEVYFSPLPSTLVTRYAGFGMAYHMAIVYTDRTGTSFGASSGPSDLTAAQTPHNAAQALLAMANDGASSFGALVSDPKNDTPFVIGRDGDYYTRGRDGQTYPHALMLKGRDLSPQWTLILQTYVLVGAQDLPYSPTTQNSNSLAGTALRRIGIGAAFSSGTVFAPGIFTELPFPLTTRPDREVPDSGFAHPTAPTEDPTVSDGATVM